MTPTSTDSPTRPMASFALRRLYGGKTLDGATTFSISARNDGWFAYSVGGRWGSEAGSVRTAAAAQRAVDAALRGRAAA
jgi:hypothetical protein